MTIILCLIIAAFAVTLLFVHGMYRIGLHDRHHLAQFVFVLMLEPGAYEDERTKFIRRVRQVELPNPSALGNTMMLELSRYAKRFTPNSTAITEAMMWKVRQSTEL